MTHVSRDNPGQSVQQLLAAAGLAQPDQILYDTFAANIVTSEDTNRDANMSVEIYLDDVLVGRVDDVVRDEHIRPISVSVNGGNVLMIKVIRTNSCYDSHAYICDTTLSVLQ